MQSWTVKILVVILNWPSLPHVTSLLFPSPPNMQTGTVNILVVILTQSFNGTSLLSPQPHMQPKALNIFSKSGNKYKYHNHCQAKWMWCGVCNRFPNKQGRLPFWFLHPKIRSKSSHRSSTKIYAIANTVHLQSLLFRKIYILHKTSFHFVDCLRWKVWPSPHIIPLLRL